MAGVQISTNTNGFLSSSFSSPTPRVYVTAETDDVSDFDQRTLQAWKSEGFEVVYLPYKNGGQGYVNELKKLGEGLKVGETYAVVSYGDAATACLEHYIRRAPKISALVAYYPSAVPELSTRFPHDLSLVVHLAGDSIGVTRTQELLGLQGKRKTQSRRVQRGRGVGGRVVAGNHVAYPLYSYEGADVGFAERDLDEFDPVAAGLAWSRSLATVRRACSGSAQGEATDRLEKARDEHVEAAFFARDATRALAPLGEAARVTYGPTSGGGIGKQQLDRFYREFFVTKHPPSLDLQLLSRTVGADRVVDEILVNFTHTTPMPWILPGVPVTGKKVEVVVVSIVTVRGGKIQHENVYWDQASVLVQAGLLDEKTVPRNMRGKMQRLPVVGAEGAKRAIGEENAGYNRLIDDW